MDRSCSYFTSTILVRTLCEDWHKQPGCRNQPLFKIKVDNIVIDELHLMLRITDRLEEGLIKDIMKWDKVLTA